MRLICFILLFIPAVCFGANRYIDPDCGTPGNGTSPTCSGLATDPYDSWIDAEAAGFSAANDYYQKCDTTFTSANTIDIASLTGSSENRITFGAYYGAGTIGVSGAEPIVQRTNVGPVFNFNAATYVEMKNLDIRCSGTDDDTALYIRYGSDNFILHDNLIGEGCGFGPRIWQADNGEIYNNIFDGDMSGPTAPLSSHDCIELGDTRSVNQSHNWLIHHNEFHDWDHTQMAVGTSSSGNEIYYNYFDGSGSTLANPGRAFSVNTGSGENIIRHNYIYNYAQKSQLSAADNTYVYGNVFDTLRESLGIGDSAEMLDLYSNDAATSDATGNKIYNNTIYGLAENGSRCFRQLVYKSNGDLFDNLLANNICLNFGSGGLGLRIKDNSTPGTGDISGNTYTNNLYYRSGSEDIVYYETALRDVDEWLALDGTDSMVISGEINVDPGLKNPSASQLWPDNAGDAVVGAGCDLNDSGADCYDAGYTASEYILDPDNTDFTTSPPTVAIKLQPVSWNIGAYALEEGADTTPPTVSGNAVIDADGLTTTINFSETVVTTGYDDGDFNVDCTVTGNNINLTSISGSGLTRTFTLASEISALDVCNLDYIGGANEIEDTSGNDLATFSDGGVTNNKTVSLPAAVFGGSIQGACENCD